MPPQRPVVLKANVAQILILSFIATAFARTRNSFDFEWRFHLGKPPGSTCNASSFPIALDDVQCIGLTDLRNISSPAACISASCAQGFTLWQFDPSSGCWGSNGDCSNNISGQTGWVGGMAVPPQPEQVCAPDSPCSPAYDDSTWRVLNVPHDSSIEATVDIHGDPNKGALPKNVSWYRKTFNLDAALQGQLVWLAFDGVFRAADIYINGAFVLHHEEGYTSFIAYLHNASAPLKFGAAPGDANVLAVYVDGTQSELWCYEGNGIYRHVWLETAPLLSFVPWSFYAPTTVTGNISGSDATAVQTADQAVALPEIDIQNAGVQGVSGTVVFELLDGSSVVLSLSVPFKVAANGGWQRVSAPPTPFGSAETPVKLWNTAKQPPLYTATASLMVTSTGDSSNGGTSSTGGSTVDAVSARIGVRSAVFDPRFGFLLNGVKVLMQGTSNHLGFGGTGMALVDRIDEFRIATLKDMGSNAFRTAHNPVAPELLDYADEYGMLVWEENRFITAGVQPISRHTAAFNMEDTQADSTVLNDAPPPPPPAPPSIPAADPRLLQDAQDMVLRDRNHPSIVIWSLCNELGCVANSPTGGTLGMQFKLALYAADQSRPVTGNTVQSPYLGGRLVDAFSQAMDVQSFSYEYNAYPVYHAQAPYKAVGGGESASCVVDRGYYGPLNSTSGYVGPNDRSGATKGGLFACVQDSWLAAATLPYVYGNFAWTGLDYLGEVYPFGGFPDISSHFGIYDLAGFAKDNAAYYRAWWRDGPTCSPVDGEVFIGLSPSHWTQPVPTGAPIDVTVTSCAAAVALYVNGVSQGPARPMPRFGVVTWPAILYAPGNLTAVAYDSDGSVLARRTIVTAGPAFALSVWVESSVYVNRTGSSIAADGQDAALVGVALVDAAGVVVPNADRNVSFVITGPCAVIGVANGDPADHSPSKASWRITFHGLARAIVASAAAGAVGPITVTATAEGVRAGSVQLTAV